MNRKHILQVGTDRVLRPMEALCFPADATIRWNSYGNTSQEVPV